MRVNPALSLLPQRLSHVCNLQRYFPLNMHELLLFGQVPARSHELVLKVLAGISASQPRTYTAHHLVFKPTRSSSSIQAAVHAARANKPNAAAVGTQQPTDVFYLQLVGHLNEAPGRTKESLSADNSFDTAHVKQSTDEENAAAIGTDSHDVVDLQRCPWTLEFRDLPNAGKQQVTSRQMNSVPITSGAPMAFVEDLGYAYAMSYLQHGHEIIHNNVQLLLIQTLPIPPNGATPNTPPVAPEPSALEPLDPSRGYMLQASLRIADQRPEIVSQGISELLVLRETLKGVVDMEAGDRLSLDTRVKG